MQIYEGLFQATPRQLGVGVEEALEKALEGLQIFLAPLKLPYLDCLGRVIVSNLKISETKSAKRRDFILSGVDLGKSWIYVTSEVVEVDPVLGLSAEEIFAAGVRNKPAWLEGLFPMLHLGMGLSIADELQGNESDLYESLVVPERFGPLLVANSGEFDHKASEALAALDEYLTFPRYLREIDSESSFNEILPPTHSIPPGYARLFRPKPSLNYGRDGTRHPLINLSELQVSDGQIHLGQWQSLAKKLRFEFAGDEALRFRSAVPHLRMLEMRLGVTDEKPETEAQSDLSADALELELKLETQEQILTDISAQLSNTKYELDFQALELEEASKEIGRLEGSRAYLKTLLAEMKVYNLADTGATAGIWDIDPTSFEEILEAIQLTETLKFTGKFSFVTQLDSQPNIGAGLTRAWNGLRALDTYASNKRDGKFQGGFFDYLLDDTHSGFKVPLNYFAAKESESVKVNPTLYDSRVFRVPEEVRTDGTAYMQAHLKVMTNHALAPRMHFLDDTSNTGQIWIGYLGPHLPL